MSNANLTHAMPLFMDSKHNVHFISHSKSQTTIQLDFTERSNM